MDQQLEKIKSQKLEVYLDRSRKSITDWLNAYVTAEARLYPRRRELMDVYDYGMLDNHLYGVVQNRKSKVMGERFHLVDFDGEPLERETNLLRKSWFYDFVEHSLDAIFYGYSLIELGDVIDGEIRSVKLVQRRNTHPERREVLIRPSDISGISFDDPVYKNNYILVDGKEGLGLLLHAMPNVIYKLFALAAWTEHAEKFSIPFLHGKTNLTDPDAVSKLENALIQAGREMILVTDHGDEIKPLQISGTDTYKIYDALTERINTELSKLIVGQTMTTDSGSSRSQAEVHDKTGGEIAESDRELIECIVNDELLPRLRSLGYPIPEEARFEFDLKREENVEDQAKVYDLLLKHYKISPEKIKAVFGIDVEEKKRSAYNQ